jgi:PAS domain S-box-containing protein
MPKATILIVEDEAIVAEDLSQKLGRLGYEVRGVTALGEEAVALARDRRPDLVLMDIRLQGRMDGVEAAELIRREGDLPVIFLTAHSDRPTLQRAKLTEPFGYILKPFEELELETHIEMALYKHQTERKLRQSEERFRTLFSTMTEGFALHQLVTDDEGRPCDYVFLEVNPAFERLTGLKRAEILGKRVREVMPATEVHWIESYGRVVLTGEPLHIENHAAALDSWYEVFAYRTAPGQFAVVFSNITERKRSQEALRHSEALLRSITDNAPDPIFLKDRASRMLLANPATLALLRKRAEDVLGKTDEEFYDDPAIGRTMMANDRRVMESGQTQVMEEVVPSPNGPRTFLSSKTPYRDAEGRVIGIIGVARDITERKRAEAALQASNKELQAWHNATVGRELRMVELKKEIDALCVQFGQPPRYGYARSEPERRA